MTSFEISDLPFTNDDIGVWQTLSSQHNNWPVVYTIKGGETAPEIYVGETLSGASRLRQHLATPQRSHLTRAQVIVDTTFNKSACLDLESYLIRLFAGDGQFQVLNRNDGIQDAAYFNRADYQTRFEEIFEELRSREYFRRSIPEIENSDLFKFSPFKALNEDQSIATNDILDGLFDDLHSLRNSTIVVQGEAGTGKTILAVYLIKLLRDIELTNLEEPIEGESIFTELFTQDNQDLMRGFRVGFVIPQQSLRETIKNVFKHTPGLNPADVLTQFEVAASEEKYDLLVVDEAHRLNRLSAQAMGTQTKAFKETNLRFFGPEGENNSQLDWILHQSHHQIFLMDIAQAVRPQDLPSDVLEDLRARAYEKDRRYLLRSQMRVKAGADYSGTMRSLVNGTVEPLPDLGEYDLRLYSDFDAMYTAVQAREDEFGLSRLVAGYAWEWKSKKDAAAADIELGNHALQWNRSSKDWINSSTSRYEVGSIHTVQGYDLNYAGVIIGPDLRFDVALGRSTFERSSYFDRRGKSNNNILGIQFSDDDILAYVKNIYGVLLSRGILGTYIYVCDPPLRERFAAVLPITE